MHRYRYCVSYSSCVPRKHLKTRLWNDQLCCSCCLLQTTLSCQVTNTSNDFESKHINSVVKFVGSGVQILWNFCKHLYDFNHVSSRTATQQGQQLLSHCSNPYKMLPQLRRCSLLLNLLLILSVVIRHYGLRILQTCAVERGMCVLLRQTQTCRLRCHYIHTGKHTQQYCCMWHTSHDR